jgi:hypothetical protein
MEQRSLRLGDIVDDYCPRERRVTNHAIVAIVEDAIRLTRCTTCEHEHEYKEAREPRRRRKSTDALHREVLTGVAGPQPAPLRAAATPVEESVAEPGRVEEPAATDLAPSPQPAASDDIWPVHRTLIRATLPKTEGEPPPPRPIPEFTMHQRPQPRGRGRFRFNHGQPPGDPFGYSRDGRRGQHGNGHGARNGNATDSNQGQGNGRRRRRRKRGGGR